MCGETPSMPKRKRNGYYGIYERSQINNPTVVFDFCCDLTEHLGDPWKRSSGRGRPYKTQPKDYAAALIYMVYERRSFRTAGKGIPKSNLHWAMKRLPLNYLRKALRLLHDWTNALLSSVWEESSSCYISDSTGISTNRREKAEHVLGFTLKREHLKLHCIAHYFPSVGLIPLVDVVSTPGRRNDSPILREMAPNVPEGDGEMPFFADRAYDAEANYELLFRRDFVPQIKKKKNTRRGRCRKRAQRLFDPTLYGRLRCVIEGIFGGTETAYGNFCRHKTSHNQGVFIVCMGLRHGVRTYLRARKLKEQVSRRFCWLAVIYWTTPLKLKAFYSPLQ
jgi:hypothetical protein